MTPSLPVPLVEAIDDAGCRRPRGAELRVDLADLERQMMESLATRGDEAIDELPGRALSISSILKLPIVKSSSGTSAPRRSRPASAARASRECPGRNRARDRWSERIETW